MNYRYALMAYDVFSSTITTGNLGDYVQSIAAKQFLPQVDDFISREKLNLYKGDPVKMIMNGWYMEKALNFPPSPQITPLYVSMHINHLIRKVFFTQNTINHLKEHAPIGCRDIGTMSMLKSKGIDSYYSGCLTLTLGKTYKRDNPNDNIYVIDPFFNMLTCRELLKQPLRLGKRLATGRLKEYNWRKKLLEKHFDDELLSDACYTTQSINKISTEDGLTKADEYLKMLCNAKLVITSRIHCALPCLAMGTPVIFLNGGFYSPVDHCRFDGILDFFNRIDVNGKTGKSNPNFSIEGKIGVNFKITNPDRHKQYAESLLQTCNNFTKVK